MGLGLVRVSLFFLPKSGEVLVNVKEHSRQINDIQLSRDMTMFVTASKDNTAKVSLGRGLAGLLPHSCTALKLPDFPQVVSFYRSESPTPTPSLSSSLTPLPLNIRRPSGQNVLSTQLPSLLTMTT